MFWNKNTRFIADFLFISLLMAVLYLAFNVFYLRSFLSSSFEMLRSEIILHCRGKDLNVK